LLAAKYLLEAGFRVTIFERHEQTAGTWDYERNFSLAQLSLVAGTKPFLPERISPLYEKLRTNVPFQSMAFTMFPIERPGVLRFAEHREVKSYLDSFTRALLDKHPDLLRILTSVEVVSTTFNGKWTVNTEHQNDHRETFRFDKLVVATGPFRDPVGGDLHDGEFAGLTLHSAYYDRPTVFLGKTVLIVGCHNSARDIFWDAMEHARHVVLGCPTEKDRYNLVFPENLPSRLLDKFVSLGRINRVTRSGRVYHTDWAGQQSIAPVPGIDVIVYCTGYNRNFSFIEKSYLPESGDGRERSSNQCFMFTAHRKLPGKLFYFHPNKARTPYNTMARDTEAQARLMSVIASQEPYTQEQLAELDSELHRWLDILYEEWFRESLNTCPCAVQNPFFMNFLNAVSDNFEFLSQSEKPGRDAMELVRNTMLDTNFRRGNIIWHSGMELRRRADCVNMNVFRFMEGAVTAGPDIDGSEKYKATWKLGDGKPSSVFSEEDIKYEDLILG
jgi:thioredoxin reductase